MTNARVQIWEPVSNLWRSWANLIEFPRSFHLHWRHIHERFSRLDGTQHSTLARHNLSHIRHRRFININNVTAWVNYSLPDVIQSLFHVTLGLHTATVPSLLLAHMTCNSLAESRCELSLSTDSFGWHLCFPISPCVFSALEIFCRYAI